MTNRVRPYPILIIAALLLLPAGLAASEAAPAPSVEEQVAGLKQMCADTAEARAQRHAEKPLFQRLGGYEKVHQLTTEVVRLHNENPALTRIMKGVDSERLATSVADFVSTGTGGEARYTGRDMTSAHAHLELTDADFLAAGGDIVKAMQTLGYGQEEIDEFVCILVSMKDLVVLEQDAS
jgi:hemoglobin